jgi:hypothetical protein
MALCECHYSAAPRHLVVEQLGSAGHRTTTRGCATGAIDSTISGVPLQTRTGEAAHGVFAGAVERHAIVGFGFAFVDVAASRVSAEIVFTAPVARIAATAVVCVAFVDVAAGRVSTGIFFTEPVSRIAAAAVIRLTFIDVRGVVSCCGRACACI